MVLGELLVLESNTYDLQRTTVSDDVLWKPTGQRYANNCSVRAFRMFHENDEKNSWWVITESAKEKQNAVDTWQISGKTVRQENSETRMTSTSR